MAFTNACSAVLTIFCVGCLGFCLKRKGWITEETAKVMPRFLTVIVLPPFLMRTIVSTFTHDELLGMLYACSVPFLSLLINLAAGALVGRIFSVHKERRGTFITAFATSNTMNVGLPITVALFGAIALPYLLLYFFASVSIFWTLGNYLLATDGPGTKIPLFSMISLKKIFSPPLIGFLAGLFFVLLDIQLPGFIDKAFKYVGDMTVGIAVIYIGILMSDIKLADLRFDRDVLLVFFGRFVFSPLCVLALAQVITIPKTMLQVFLIMASLPVMINVAVLSAFYKSDVKYAAVLVSSSTLLSMITVPLWAILGGIVAGN